MVVILMQGRWCMVQKHFMARQQVGGIFTVRRHGAVSHLSHGSLAESMAARAKHYKAAGDNPQRTDDWSRFSSNHYQAVQCTYTVEGALCKKYQPVCSND